MTHFFFNSSVISGTTCKTKQNKGFTYLSLHRHVLTTPSKVLGGQRKHAPVTHRGVACSATSLPTRGRPLWTHQAHPWPRSLADTTASSERLHRNRTSNVSSLYQVRPSPLYARHPCTGHARSPVCHGSVSLPAPVFSRLILTVPATLS